MKIISYFKTRLICFFSIIFAVSLGSSCNQGYTDSGTDSYSKNFNGSPYSETEITYPDESSEDKPSYKRISAEDALAMMEGENVFILDVRTKSEFEQGHIPGSILLPVDKIGSSAYEVLPDKDGVILIYCRSGNRSYHAAKELISMGYTNVYDFGGIINWPYEIIR